MFACCAVQLPMATATAAPGLAQQQADVHAVGDTAVDDGTSLPPKLPSLVPYPASCSEPSRTDNQPREMRSRQPVGPQEGGSVAAAASECASCPAATPPAQQSSPGWCIPGRQALPESAAHVVLDISGSYWGHTSEREAAIASCASKGAATVRSPDQNLGCMPPPSGQKSRRLMQEQIASPEDSCSGPPWQVQHRGALVADSLPSRAPSRDSMLSFEALATRSHTSGLDLSTACWLISGHSD